MEDDASGSVEILIGLLKAGHRDAIEPLWQRYFASLVRHARDRLVRLGVSTSTSDEEDLALSAFKSFCAGAERGQYPRLDDRSELWRLLLTIVRNKALMIKREQLAQKRGGDQVVCETDLTSDHEVGTAGLDAIANLEPSPEEVAIVIEESQRLLRALGDERLRRIAMLKLEGYTNNEIKDKMSCSLRSVTLKIELIREVWGRKQDEHGHSQTSEGRSTESP